MSIPLNINGETYNYPETGDTDWGSDATDWAEAVTVGTLQKAGGLFQLLDEVDFGTAFGVKSLYYKTRSNDIATIGQFRLANDDLICWRNNDNDGDLSLTVDGNDALNFNGTSITVGGDPVQVAITPVDTATIDLTLDGSNNLSADINPDSIDNSMIASAAGIVNSKLAEMATLTIKGNSTGGSATPSDLSVSTVTGMLNSFVGDSGSGGTKGLVPAPGIGDATKVLFGDGTWDDVSSPLPNFTDQYILFGDGTNVPATSSKIQFEDSTNVLLIGTDTAESGSLQLGSTGGSGGINAGSGGLQLFSEGDIDLVTDTGGDILLRPSGSGLTGVVRATSGVLSASAQLPLSAGGTNKNMTAVAGGIVYTDADSMEVTSAGTAGQWVLSGGSGAPTMSDTTTRAKVIDGSSDTVQLVVEGFAGQANNVMTVQTSGAGATLLGVTPSNGTIIRGTTTNDSAAAGDVGQPVRSAVLNQNFPTSTQFGDLTSISLTAGDWDVSALLNFQPSGSITYAEMGISTTSGNSSSGLSYGDNYAGIAVTGVYTLGAIPSYRISLSGTTNVYLKFRSSYTGGPPQASGRISARRVR